VPAAKTGPESTTKSTTAKASADGSFRTFYLLAHKGPAPHPQLGLEHSAPAGQCIVTDAPAPQPGYGHRIQGMAEAASGHRQPPLGRS
jgi:hypothetical protein